MIHISTPGTPIIIQVDLTKKGQPTQGIVINDKQGHTTAIELTNDGSGGRVIGTSDAVVHPHAAEVLVRSLGGLMIKPTEQQALLELLNFAAPLEGPLFVIREQILKQRDDFRRETVYAFSMLSNNLLPLESDTFWISPQGARIRLTTHSDGHELVWIQQDGEESKPDVVGWHISPDELASRIHMRLKELSPGALLSVKWQSLALPGDPSASLSLMNEKLSQASEAIAKMNDAMLILGLETSRDTREGEEW